MQNKKRLIFVHFLEQALSIKDRKNYLFVLCNHSEENKFKENNINFIFIDAYVDEESFKNQDSEMYSFVNSIFEKFNEYTSYKDINLGRMIAWDLKFIFSELLFYYKCVFPIVKKFRPQEITVFKNNLLDRHMLFKFFREDPLIEALSFIKTKDNFNIETKNSFSLTKGNLKSLPLSLLRLFQRTAYRINPNKTKKPTILLSGSIRNIRALKNSSKISENYNFHTILDSDALELNLSKDFFFTNPRLFFNGKKSKRDFIKKYNSISQIKKFKDSFKFGKLSLFGLFENRIKIIFYEILPSLAYAYDYLSRFLDKINPKAVCVMEDVSSFSRLLVNTANKKRIPTFVMQYGLYSKKNMSAFWPSDSKYKLLWGQTDKKLFVSLGSNPQNIFVVGAPRFKDYGLNKNLSKTNFFKKANISQDKKLFLYFSNYIDFLENRYFSPGYALCYKEYEELLKILLRVFSSKKDSHLLIYLRPNGEKPNLHKKLIKEMNLDNVTVTTNKILPVEEGIFSSDGVITGWSTTGLEAMLLKKLLLTYKFRYREDIVGFLKYKAAYGFKTKEELTKLLNNSEKLTNKNFLNNQLAYIKDYLKGDQEIFNVIDRIIKQSK